jgi:hypothetical protein
MAKPTLGGVLSADPVNPRDKLAALAASQSQLDPQPVSERAQMAVTGRIVAPVKAKHRKVTFELPEYLADELAASAFHNRSTVRQIVLQALRDKGFRVDSEDLVDRRRDRTNRWS